MHNPCVIVSSSHVMMVVFKMACWVPYDGVVNQVRQTFDGLVDHLFHGLVYGNPNDHLWHLPSFLAPICHAPFILVHGQGPTERWTKLR